MRSLTSFRVCASHFRYSLSSGHFAPPRQLVVPDARQLKPLHLASNLLILNHRKIIPFTANPLFSRQKQQTLNQRVQGSSPCAPTKQINCLRGNQPASQAQTNFLVTWLVTFRPA